MCVALFLSQGWREGKGRGRGAARQSHFISSQSYVAWLNTPHCARFYTDFQCMCFTRPPITAGPSFVRRHCVSVQGTCSRCASDKQGTFHTLRVRIIRRCVSVSFPISLLRHRYSCRFLIDEYGNNKKYQNALVQFKKWFQFNNRLQIIDVGTYPEKI